MNNNELKQKRLKGFVDCLKLCLCEITNTIWLCKNSLKNYKFTLHRCDIAAIGYYLWQLVNHRDRYEYMEYEEAFIDGLDSEGFDERHHVVSLRTILASLSHVNRMDRFLKILFQNEAYEWPLLDESQMIIGIDVGSVVKLINQPVSQDAIALSVISELIVLNTLLDIEPSKRVEIYLKFLVFSRRCDFSYYPQFRALAEKDVTYLKNVAPEDILSSAKNILQSLFTSESEWGAIEDLLFKISGTAYALGCNYEERCADNVLQGSGALKKYEPGLIFWTLFHAHDNKNDAKAVGKKFENFYYLLYQVLMHR